MKLLALFAALALTTAAFAEEGAPAAQPCAAPAAQPCAPKAEKHEKAEKHAKKRDHKGKKEKAHEEHK